MDPISIFFVVLIVAVLLVFPGLLIYELGQRKGEESVVLDFYISDLPIGVPLRIVQRLNETLCIVRREKRKGRCQRFWRISGSTTVFPEAHQVFMIVMEQGCRKVQILPLVPEQVLVTTGGK